MRHFCMRFDVDTHRCLRKGVPSLLLLAEQEGVEFTFFVNMGRAVSLTTSLKRARGAPPAKAKAPRLSARRKLGLRGYLTAAVLNPKVGDGTPSMVRCMAEKGHDVGLHGGRNHAQWQASAATWTANHVSEEISFAADRFFAATGSAPVGFASPGFVGPPALPTVLSSLGFEYVADQHGPDASVSSVGPGLGIISLPTRLTGEPGGVAYLEWGRARGLDQAAILRQFERDLETDEDLLIMYDHPYHAGIHEVETLRAMIRLARDRGFEIASLRAVANTFRHE